MSLRKKNELAVYKSPGFETVYTGEIELPQKSQADPFFVYEQDCEGNVYITFSCWGFSHPSEEFWNDEIKHINSLQKHLGVLDESTRRIRIQISNLQCCDSGVPVTVDEILNAIGMGHLPKLAFHCGCWLSIDGRTTQPEQKKTMQIIEKILLAYINGYKKDDLIRKYPYAKGFIKRIFEWLGPVEKLSNLQKLMLERLLLPFEFLTGRTLDYKRVNSNCFETGGKGELIDKKISSIAKLPKIFPNYKPEFHDNQRTINDTQKCDLYSVCCAMSHGLHGLSDCHHSSFRWIESWIHGIGHFSLKIVSRKAGVESRRLGQLLFGYALGIDRWLQNIPIQWLLLDLGHIDLGFDPKNEILRVYSYLGEKTPVKEWLAACLWYTLVLERPASLYDWGYRYKELIKSTEEKGVSVQDWMTKVLSSLVIV